MRSGLDHFTDFSICVCLLVNYTKSSEITCPKSNYCDWDKIFKGIDEDAGAFTEPANHIRRIPLPCNQNKSHYEQYSRLI